MTQDNIEGLVFANATAIARLTEMVKETTEDVDKLTVHSESMQPCKAKVDTLNKKMDQLSFILLMARYPRLLLTGLLGSYLFAIKDVRDVVLLSLGLAGW